MPAITVRGKPGSRAGRATRHDVGVVREVLNAREDAQVFRDVELAENVHYEISVGGLGLSGWAPGRRRCACARCDSR